MSEITKHWGDPPKDIDNPEWDLIDINPSGIVVTWTEKYGGTYKENCIGLWYSDKTRTYMLTWKDSRKEYLLKDNINSIEVGGK